MLNLSEIVGKLLNHRFADMQKNIMLSLFGFYDLFGTIFNDKN